MADIGDTVQVRADMPPGHVRTPAYLRGKTGIIERVLGPFQNPEERAYGHPGTPQPLYRVRFSMDQIWGDKAEHPRDTLEAEIYGHWLAHPKDPPDAP